MIHADKVSIMGQEINRKLDNLRIKHFTQPTASLECRINDLSFADSLALSHARPDIRLFSESYEARFCRVSRRVIILCWLLGAKVTRK